MMDIASVDDVSQLTALVERGANVLSNQEGPFKVTSGDRGLMCLVELPDRPGHGVLAVSSSHQLDPHVLAYQESVRRQGFRYRILVCSMAGVLDLYRLQGTESLGLSINESDVQRHIVRWIGEGAAAGASDLHIVARHDYCELRSRIHGHLHTSGQVRASEGLRLCATIYQSMCDVAEPTFKPLQAQRARMKEEFLSECGLSGVRVNTRPLVRGMLMVLRLLYADSPNAPRSLEQLGYLPEQCQLFEEMMEQRTGVVMLSGPTGSGKSTTLKVVLQQVLAKESGIHLLTLEDPPEYTIEGANQSPITGARDSGADIEQEWAMAISDTLRLDPDVIMVGEIRDATTAKMTFRAAMTGHFIWTTIHANDALAILPRLQDEGVMETLLTDPHLVVGLVNQVLVQLLCPHCKIPLAGNEHELSPRLLERLRRYCQPETICLQGPGCAKCRNTGLAGRTVVAEVLRTTPGLMQAFQAGRHYGAYEYWIKSMGGMSKVDVLIRKVNEGGVDPRAGERVVGPLVPPFLE